MHYAQGRFANDRRRRRDARLVARLMTRAGLDAVPAQLVLDAPCGTGRLSGALRRFGARVVALDVSWAMLTADRAAFGASEGHARPQTALAAVTREVARVQASGFALPFRDRAFDAVVACRLLHHFASTEDRRALLGEFARVSSRWVIASYWDAASWHAWRRRAPGPLRRKGHDPRVAISPRDLAADLAHAGLVPIARAHSLRFVSPQAFLLAEVSPPPAR
ncbi:MAG: class I SAM-dependent methyltransferase [Planctomycetota bacterium]